MYLMINYIIMNSKIIKRINSEIKQINEEITEGVSIILTDDLKRFYANIEGPPDSPYQGKFYKLEIKLPDNYPISPPKIKFISNIFHPNVYKDGKICLDILRGDQWTPSLKISTALLSIRSLFTDPDPTSAANPEAGRLYMTDMEKFNKKVLEV